MQAYASTLEIRAKRRELGGPADRQAPLFRQESEGGIRRRMRRQPGGESGWRCCLSMEPSVRAAVTHGARLGGSHHGLGNGGCCEVGEPARVLFDTAARDDHHKYSDRSLRETGRGSSRAASGGPPLEIRGRDVLGRGGLRPAHRKVEHGVGDLSRGGEGGTRRASFYST